MSLTLTSAHGVMIKLFSKMLGPVATPSVDDAHASAVKSPGKRLAWLDFLRALAVLLVLWGHLVGGFLSARGLTWAPSDIVSRYVFEPLAISQHGGFLGVCIFFLVSGYIIARVIGRESIIQFAVRRCLRIFPLLFVVAFSVWLLGRFGVLGMPADAYKAPFIHVVTNTILLNYVVDPQVILVGPAWSLVVEVCFYLAALLLLPFLRRRSFHPLALPVLLILASLFSSFFSRNFGPNFFLLAVSLAYLPILAIGSLFFLYESRQVTATIAALLGGVAWIVFLKAIQQFYPQFMQPTANSYPVSVMAALAIFALVFGCRHKINRIPRLLTWVALVSYSIYLWHGVIALPMEAALISALGFNASLLLSLLALTVAAHISYRLIEAPLQALAKKIC
jgi:peptidoglycan/LPS O-acetylase OafA/YrhL